MDCAEPLATNAMRDLIELTLLAKYCPLAANALCECFEFSIPVLTIDIEGDSAMVTRKPIIHFKLNETLMAHLSALRVKKREYADAIRIGLHDGLSVDEIINRFVWIEETPNEKVSGPAKAG